MNTIKILKTEEDYEAALAQIETLMDAAPGSPEEDELELLGMLVEQYEREVYPIEFPDPVEAIKFRMEQEGLTNSEMIKYLGSQSKVSEVLNYKRPLSITMIRNLHQGLGIPAEVLLQEPEADPQAQPDVEAVEHIDGGSYSWRDYPFREMFKCNYFKSFNGTYQEARSQASDLLADFFVVLQSRGQERIYCRQAEKEIDLHALQAWQARSLYLAMKNVLPEFDRSAYGPDLIQEVIHLSYFDEGPRLAQEFLRKKGIHCVVLKHLPKTYLDGACFYAPDYRPVVGLTLRYDRLDNFWFTLAHELAHLYLHLGNELCAYFDNTENPGKEAEQPEEQAANQFAKDILIPARDWEDIKVSLEDQENEDLLQDISDRLQISSAIVVGRIRWESGNYKLYNNLVGNGKVRTLFREYQ